EGLDIVLFGANHGELGGSEYLLTLHGLLRGQPPVLDLERERALQQLLVRLAADGLIRSAQDCAEGGLAVALAECCFDTGGLGAAVDLAPAASDGGVDLVAATLFGESASRVIVSVEPAATAAGLEAAARPGVPAARLGTTGGHGLRLGVEGTTVVDVDVRQAERAWSSAIGRQLDTPVA